MTAAAVFAVTLLTLMVAHEIGDFWVQTDWQSAHKGLTRDDAKTRDLHPLTGPRACAAHVATYTLTALTLLTPVAILLHLGLSPARTAAALAVSALSHYWADRRHTLRALAERVGHGAFYRLGAPRPGHDDNPTLGTGSHALDQAYHRFWLLIAALIAASTVYVTPLAAYIGALALAGAALASAELLHRHTADQAWADRPQQCTDDDPWDYEPAAAHTPTATTTPIGT